MSIDFKCASYSRLSRDDEDKKDESSSIKTQKQIIQSFASFNHLNVVKEYTDDGFSGGNFERPGFQEMLGDIEKGKINCVITKDLSRLGREIYTTGTYIEQYFLERGVRYIAINDGYDSNIGDAMLGIRLGVNDLYLRDVSRKVSTSLKAKQEKGDYIGSLPCYGYIKDPNDKHHLIPDINVKDNVVKMFELADNGYGVGQIANYFTKNKIPIPAVYKKEKRAIGITANNGNGIWRHQTIACFLSSQMYIGNMVQHTYHKISYRSKKLRSISPEDYIIVENTHEPLIDKKLFDRVQLKLKNTKRKSITNNSINYLFKGLLKCKDCGRTISVHKKATKTSSYLYTCCNYYSKNRNEKRCSPHRINYSALEIDLLKFVKTIGKKFLEEYNTNDIKNKCQKMFDSTTNDLIENQNNIKIIIKKNEDIIAKLYTDRLDETITVETYKTLVTRYENEIKSLKEKETEIKEKLATYKSELNNQKYIECEKKIKELLSLKNPNNEIIREIVDRVEIDENKNVEVYFKLAPLEVTSGIN